MITDDTFDDAVLRSKKQLSIVMLWQPGCAFCKVMLHALAAVARALPGVNFVVMNGHTNPKTSERFDVSAYPALLAFRDGELIDRRMGAAPIDSVLGWIKEKA
jgi:thioredoxin 1